MSVQPIMTDAELIVWLKSRSRATLINSLDVGKTGAGKWVRSRSQIFDLAAERIIELTAERDAWKLRAGGFDATT